MKTLSMDLRARVLDAQKEGLPKSQIALRFKTSLSTVKRWLKRHRESGSIAPLPRPGRTPTIDQQAQALLKEWVEEQNDLTLEELRERWAEHGFPVALSTVDDWLGRLGFSQKKNDARQRTGASRYPGTAPAMAANDRRRSRRAAGVSG